MRGASGRRRRRGATGIRSRRARRSRSSGSTARGTGAGLRGGLSIASSTPEPLRGEAGVLGGAGVEVVVRAVRIGSPDLTARLGQGAELPFALPQRLLDLLVLGDVPASATVSRRPPSQNGRPRTSTGSTDPSFRRWWDSNTNISSVSSLRPNSSSMAGVTSGSKSSGVIPTNSSRVYPSSGTPGDSRRRRQAGRLAGRRRRWHGPRTSGTAARWPAAHPPPASGR